MDDMALFGEAVADAFVMASLDVMGETDPDPLREAVFDLVNGVCCCEACQSVAVA